MKFDRDALFADPKSCVYRLVRQKARQLVRKPGLKPEDQADLEQDLLLEVWERLNGFDPEQATLTNFLETTLNFKARNILRDRCAAKRDFQRDECSLDEIIPMGDEGMAPRSQIFAEEARYAHTQTQRLSELEQTELAMDLETVLANLSEDLKELCALLPNFSLREIAQRQGRSRRHVSLDVARLRHVFEEAGLGDYFHHRPSLPRRA